MLIDQNLLTKNRTKSKSKWLIIIDADEFILPKKCNTLRHFLNDYNDFHALGINWIMFGSNNHLKKQFDYRMNMIIQKYILKHT